MTTNVRQRAEPVDLRFEDELRMIERLRDAEGAWAWLPSLQPPELDVEASGRRPMDRNVQLTVSRF